MISRDQERALWSALNLAVTAGAIDGVGYDDKTRTWTIVARIFGQWPRDLGPAAWPQIVENLSFAIAEHEKSARERKAFVESRRWELMLSSMSRLAEAMNEAPQDDRGSGMSPEQISTVESIRALAKQRDAAEARAAALESEHKVIREALGAMIPSLSEVHVCHFCPAIATRRLWISRGMSWFGCDDHKGNAHHEEDLPFARAFRALRALLGGGQ